MRRDFLSGALICGFFPLFAIEHCLSNKETDSPVRRIEEEEAARDHRGKQS